MFNFTYLLLLLTAYSTVNINVNAEDTLEDGMEMENSTDKVVQVDRILAGKPVLERDHRYMVAIMRLKNGSPVLICGGAIIHRRYVLTAAHCVHSYKSIELVVRHGGVGGSNDLSPQDDGRTFHPVVKTFIPRVYSSLPCRKHHHDIAILKVSQIFDLVDFNRYAKVNLPEFHADYEGYSATVTGYGPDYASAEGEQSQPRYLQYVTQLRALDTTVMANEECQNLAKVVLTAGSLCAKALNPASQTCFEDDGGPLVHDGTIIGILNERQCDFEVPELFTRVSAYLHFIKTVLDHQLSYDILIL